MDESATKCKHNNNHNGEDKCTKMSYVSVFYCSVLQGIVGRGLTPRRWFRFGLGAKPPDDFRFRFQFPAKKRNSVLVILRFSLFK